MPRAHVGWSKAACPVAAAKEAVGKALSGVTEPAVVLFYASAVYDQKELAAAAKEAAGNVPVMGGTSFTGVITPDGFIGGDEGFCGAIALGGCGLAVAAAGEERGECPREAGRKAAAKAIAELGKAPSFFFMIAPPGEEEQYLKGIEDVVGRIPFFGGSSGDNDMSGKMKQYAEGVVVENGVAAAFFATTEKFANAYTGAYRNTGKCGVITKVEGRRLLVEIDGKPALDSVAAWMGKTPAELQGGNLLGATITAPLGVVDSEGDLVWVRHPLSGNPDGTMQIGNDLAEGTAVCLLEATRDELVESVPAAAKKALGDLGVPAGALLIVHCAGRAVGIGDRMEETVVKLKAACGDVPFLGILTFGEYGYAPWSRNGCGGLTLSFMALEK